MEPTTKEPDQHAEVMVDDVESRVGVDIWRRSSGDVEILGRLSGDLGESCVEAVLDTVHVRSVEAEGETCCEAEDCSCSSDVLGYHSRRGAESVLSFAVMG